MRTYYHATDERNVNSILTKGLIPALGPRSKKAAELRELIFLFRTKNDLCDGLYGWLSEEYIEYTDAEKLAILEINIPNDSDIEVVADNYSVAKFEAYCDQVIPPQYITHIQNVCL